MHRLSEFCSLDFFHEIFDSWNCKSTQSLFVTSIGPTFYSKNTTNTVFKQEAPFAVHDSTFYCSVVHADVVEDVILCRKVVWNMIPHLLENYDESRDTHYLEIDWALTLCNPRDLPICDPLEGLEEEASEVCSPQHSSRTHLRSRPSGCELRSFQWLSRSNICSTLRHKSFRKKRIYVKKSWRTYGLQDETQH